MVGALVKPSLKLDVEVEDDNGVKKALVFFIKEGREGAMLVPLRANDSDSRYEGFLRMMTSQVQANRP